MYVAGECSRSQKKGRSKMDFEKLYDLSCSVNTWTEFVFEHAVAIKKISCSLSGDLRTKNEKFLNENNIEGV